MEWVLLASRVLKQVADRLNGGAQPANGVLKEQTMKEGI
jgi:hypothetical protein